MPPMRLPIVVISLILIWPVLVQGESIMTEHDLIVRNGLIYNGSGSKPFASEMFR